LASAHSPRVSQLRFRSLHLLRLIDECGSVRKAAESMHVTQPAASAMLREVEQALGIELFVRSHSGMAATPALKALLRRARVIAHELDAIAQDAAAQQQRSREILRLGVLPRSMQNIMPAVLADLVGQHPGLELVLTESTSDVLLHGLARGEFDAVVGRYTRDAANLPDGGRGFRLQTLYEEGMCVVSGRTHPLAGRKRLGLADTLQYDWVLPPQGSVTRNLLIDEFLHIGLPPPVPLIQSANFLSNLALAEQGLLTVSPFSAARKFERLQGIRILDLPLHMPLPPISLLWHKDRPLEGPMQALRNALIRSVPGRPSMPNDAGLRRGSRLPG